nr:MAG TPA: rhoptry-associated protein 1 [Caudoviricetes sp.]DAL69242.1 MAG TPA: rhoptry-associated protein 1 [Caudoviricetes sp.]
MFVLVPNVCQIDLYFFLFQKSRIQISLICAK